MSSVFDIARSGLRSYQTALAVTAENIANVNTAGYARQDVRLTGLHALGATATSAAGTGAGVAVADVTRAFSGLLADRTRLAGSAEAAAGRRTESAAALEAFFTPGQGGIDAVMAEFQKAFSALTAAPASLPLRQVAVQAGGALAARIAETAQGLADLRADVGTAAGLAAGRVTTALAGLASVNDDLARAEPGSTATNGLATTRDALLKDLAGQIGIATTLDSRGRAEVTLAGSGARLLGAEGAVQAEATLADRLQLALATPDGGLRNVALLSGGVLGGLSDGLGMLDAAMAELDAFAKRLAGAANAMQAAGTDLSGATGRPMFSLQSWSAAAATTNTGTAQPRLIWPATGGPEGPIRLAMTEDGTWTATDQAGTQLGRGETAMVLEGLVIAMNGSGQPGDSFILDRREGAAEMAMTLQDGRDIAAARRLALLPATGNAGTATASITAVASSASGLSAVSTVLAAGRSAAASVAPLAAGIVAEVTAQGGDLALQSLGSPARATFAVTDTDLAGAEALEITTTTGSYRFDLAVLADGSPRPADWSPADLATALNSGQILADGRSLAQLGLQAAGDTGQLQLASVTAISAARLLSDGNPTAATLTPAAAAGGVAQVFTRNGVHLAGTPLTAAEAAAFLTEANGFLPGASYDASGLNAGYRGMQVDVIAIPGAQTASLPMGGLMTAAEGSPDPAAARPLRLAIPGVGSSEITVPEGASAAQAAALIDGALPGLAARASTAALLRVPDGHVSFELSGANAIPVTITAEVQNGDLSALAARITATSAATGLRAELAPEGGRLLLISDTGESIDIGAYSHSAAVGLTITEAGPDGAELGGQAVLDAETSAARILGRVTARAATAFDVTQAGATQSSAADPATGGLFALTSAAAGAQLRLEPGFDPAVDGGSSSGSTAYAPGTRYGVTLGSRSVTVDAMETGAQSAADITTALARALRAGTPDAGLQGTALAVLPADGNSVELLADGQSYTLTMQDGQPVVTGPEPGRITASIGADNRISLSMTGSADGSAIRLAAPASAAAAAFGLGSGALQLVRGGTVSVADLPAGGLQLPVTVNGVSHFVTVAAGGAGVIATAPAGFPGSVTVEADGAISLWVPQSAGTISIGTLPDAGFTTLGAAVGVDGAGLAISGAEGARPDLAFTAESLAPQRLSLSGLPAEDLLVGMTGDGALNLAGGATSGASASGPVALEVLDAATGAIALLDATTGDRIAQGYLDAEGRATLGGHAITLGGGAATGDRFILTAADAGSGDGDNLASLLDGWSGTGGLIEDFNLLVSDIGSQTAAAAAAQDTAQTRLTAARSAEAELSAVDLDTEAARLMELQQAYQGNAKALNVARDLFDTLLKAI